VVKLATLGMPGALASNPDLARGVNVHRGNVTYRAVAEAFGIEYRPLG
jgi:alanine dehydrogenase